MGERGHGMDPDTLNDLVEVSIEGEYLPALKDVRVMYTTEALKLLYSGRGRLAGRLFCVGSANKLTYRLRPGQGVLLYISGIDPRRLVHFGEFSGEGIVHAVVLYRGLDGDYCFFDSNFQHVPNDEVVAATVRSGPGQVYWYNAQYGMQGVGLGTCQYHCLAFMSFVVQHSHLPTWALI